MQERCCRAGDEGWDYWDVEEGVAVEEESGMVSMKDEIMLLLL